MSPDPGLEVDLEQPPQECIDQLCGKLCFDWAGEHGCLMVGSYPANQREDGTWKCSWCTSKEGRPVLVGIEAPGKDELGAFADAAARTVLQERFPVVVAFLYELVERLPEPVEPDEED